MDWPDRGVYFFFASGERRGDGQHRVTRVGTHAVSTGSGTTLWDRLKQHYGTGSGSSSHPHGGNQRGSVFRREGGRALVERYALRDQYPAWDRRQIGDADRDRDTVREEEYPLERWVSASVRDPPFLWVAVDDEPGPGSDRTVLESNALGLLSNLGKESLDPRPAWWLGNHSQQPKIRESGLWNVRDVDSSYDAAFLETLEEYVERTGPL